MWVKLGAGCAQGPVNIGAALQRDERSPVAAHFKQAGHSVSALRYVGVEYVSRPPRGGDHGKRLRQRETFWIYYLNQMSPNGLN